MEELLLARRLQTAEPRSQAALVELCLQVPAQACSLQLSVSFRKAFLSVFEHPPDAHRGFDIPAALMALPSQQKASCTADNACIRLLLVTSVPGSQAIDPSQPQGKLHSTWCPYASKGSWDWTALLPQRCLASCGLLCLAPVVLAGLLPDRRQLAVQCLRS